MSKDPSDPLNFVLLKKGKKYDPSWDSKWGKVRPGWHIECSAMASTIFGNKIDIHSGGIDLSFPHHHNEQQQSNSYFYPKKDGQWVEHFMHMGHLNIHGLKMSRSLKNFITVDQALKIYRPESLRMLFTLHMWMDPMDFSDDTMEEADNHINYFSNFFVQIKSVLLRNNVTVFKKLSQYEKHLISILAETQQSVDMAIRDNLNIPRTIHLIRHLISQLYKYISDIENLNHMLDRQTIESVVHYVDKMLSIYGLCLNKNNNQSNDQIVTQLVQTISTIRTEIREINKKTKNSELWKLSDKIRDEMLPKLGIQLTDK
jgi:cysteinyl-tRNA synthetase